MMSVSVSEDTSVIYCARCVEIMYRTEICCYDRNNTFLSDNDVLKEIRFMVNLKHLFCSLTKSILSISRFFFQSLT